jgi:hypothetical protein
MVAKLVTTMFFVVVLGEFWALRNGGCGASGPVGGMLNPSPWLRRVLRGTCHASFGSEASPPAVLCVISARSRWVVRLMEAVRRALWAGIRCGDRPGRE